MRRLAQGQARGQVGSGSSPEVTHGVKCSTHHLVADRWFRPGHRTDLDSPSVALTIGIVGLPNAGKSTLFNALTKNDVLAANYPFATIEPNVGVVGVPDERLPKLAEVFGSEKILPATVEFVDIAGIVRGASQGEGLGNKFLAHIRESAAICQVTRVFRDEDVTHVDGEVNPGNDISTIQTELILADLETVDKAVVRLEKEARKVKDLVANLEAAKAAKDALEAGTPIIATDIDRSLLRELSLLTAKPFIYVFNCDADELHDEDLKQQMRDLVAPAEAIFLDAKFESELIELDDEEAAEFLAEAGVTEPGLEVLARVGFDTLGLQTYLTAGPKESRAWTIKKGATAPEAAGVIHTDFQKGFIKAEVVSFDDLMEAGTMLKAKEAGKVRMEGKDYVMVDGDVVEFRFNV
jgi:GTP-binding protein YchF